MRVGNGFKKEMVKIIGEDGGLESGGDEVLKPKNIVRNVKTGTDKRSSFNKIHTQIFT